jgi:hypothetical protein
MEEGSSSIPPASYGLCQSWGLYPLAPFPLVHAGPGFSCLGPQQDQKKKRKKLWNVDMEGTGKCSFCKMISADGWWWWLHNIWITWCHWTVHLTMVKMVNLCCLYFTTPFFVRWAEI